MAATAQDLALPHPMDLLQAGRVLAQGGGG